MINRRITRKGARGVLAAAAIGLLAPAVSAPLTSPAQAANVDGPSVFWKFSVWGNPRAFTSGIVHLAERLEEETGGQFKMRVFHGEQISKAKENLDGLKAGAFEAAAFCNFYHPGKNPALMVMTMPFLPIPDFDTAWDVRMGLYDHPILRDEMAAWNAMYYVSTNLPQYEFMGVGDPPTKPEDFSGLRVRAGGGVGMAMEKMGATRQSMPATEVYTALQRGTIDAESLPYTYAHASYKIHEVADWFTSNMSPGTSDCPVVISKSAWDALPSQYQQLLEDLKPEVKEVYKQAYADADARNLPMFREAMTEVVYDDAQLAAFREAAGRPIWDQWVADNQGDFDAQAVLDLVLELSGGGS